MPGSTASAWKTRGARLVDVFVPAEVAAGVDGPRARMAVGISLLMASVFAMLALAHAVAGKHDEALANAVLVAVMLLGPYVLRRTGRYGAVVNLTIALAFSILAYLVASERGAGVNAATVALAEVPLFATLLAGPRTGALWLLASCAANTSLGLAAHAGIVRHAAASNAALLNDHVVLVVVASTLYLVAALYESGRARGLAHIARLDEEHRRVEREKLEAQAEARVARAQRLASLGRMAAAAAHEINNPLSYVTNNIEYLEQQLPSAHRREDIDIALRDALEGVQRIRHIVADLTTYAPLPDAGSAQAGDRSPAAEQLELQSAEQATPTAPRARRRRLLVVDDEPLVARAIQRRLYDHDVQVVHSGRAALALLDAGHSFDLVLCDVMMPDLHGMDVYEEVSKRHPSLVDRLVFMTGAAFTERARTFRAKSQSPFLEKPLDIERLRALLEAKAGAAARPATSSDSPPRPPTC